MRTSPLSRLVPCFRKNRRSLRCGISIRPAKGAPFRTADAPCEGRPLPADSEDQAIELENQEALEVIEKTETTEIHQIEAALKRISEGTYGTCALCDFFMLIHGSLHPVALKGVVMKSRRAIIRSP